MTQTLTQTQVSAVQRSLPCCTKCKKEFDRRIPRGALVKSLLPWLPLKRYVCYRCNTTRYKLD